MKEFRIALGALVAAGLTAVVLWVGAPSAVASPIKECGDLPNVTHNITARAVSCAEARRVVRGWNRLLEHPLNGRGNWHVRGLACRFRGEGNELFDIRCTGSRGRVVRWQEGV